MHRKRISQEIESFFSGDLVEKLEETIEDALVENDFDQPELTHMENSLLLHMKNVLAGDGIYIQLHKIGKNPYSISTEVSSVYPVYQYDQKKPEELTKRVLKIYKKEALEMLSFRGLKDEGDIQKRCCEARVSVPEIIAYCNSPSKEVYLLMDYIEGKSLNEIINNQNEQQAKTILNVCIDLGKELFNMHRKAGVIHLDLKPENVMVRQEDIKPCPFDFGFSIFTGGVPRKKIDYIKSPLNFIGTPSYMAPEFLFEKMISPKLDQYAYGMIIHKAATGSTPFEGMNLRKNIEEYAQREGITSPDQIDLTVAMGDFGELKQQSIKVDTKKILPGYPKEIKRVIEKCLERDPNKRYVSCAHASLALRTVVENHYK
ncbi:MAG: protein kinase [Candidatus Woesearchaeota archaeon]